MEYADEGVPLCVLAGKEYGSGSSRDWAAKGPRLLGVRFVLAESYERIHRSNLVGMGVLPLQFPDGESVESLGLTGLRALRPRAARGGRAHAARSRPRPTTASRSRSTRASGSTRPTSGSTSAAAASSTTCCASCVRADSRIRHHDLCFGCGQANLFGLQLELRAGAGRRRGGPLLRQAGPPGPAGLCARRRDRRGPRRGDGAGRCTARGRWRSPAGSRWTCSRRRRWARSWTSAAARGRRATAHDARVARVGRGRRRRWPAPGRPSCASRPARAPRPGSLARPCGPGRCRTRRSSRPRRPRAGRARRPRPRGPRTHRCARAGRGTRRSGSCEVVEPGGVLRGARLGCDQDDPVAVGDVEERGLSRAPRSSPRPSGGGPPAGRARS